MIILTLIIAYLVAFPESIRSLFSIILLVNLNFQKEEGSKMRKIEQISGKTLEVYLLLMELKESVGVRETQRILNYSSSNLAFYHLNKLYELDLAEKTNDNKYLISKLGRDKQLGPYKNRFKLLGNWVSDFYLLFLVFLTLSAIGIMFALIGVSNIVWSVTFVPAMIALSSYYWKRYSSLSLLEIDGTN